MIATSPRLDAPTGRWGTDLKIASAWFSNDSGALAHHVPVQRGQPKEIEMNMSRKFAIAGASILSLIGLGAGTAVAQGNSPPRVPAVVAAAVTPAPAAASPVGIPGDSQQSDQTVANQAPSGATETVESESDTSGPEPGDVALPGGGHADPPGQTVDHQFQGAE